MSSFSSAHNNMFESRWRMSKIELLVNAANSCLYGFRNSFDDNAQRAVFRMFGKLQYMKFSV